MAKEFILNTITDCPRCRCKIYAERKVDHEPDLNEIAAFADATKKQHEELHKAASKALALEEIADRMAGDIAAYRARFE